MDAHNTKRLRRLAESATPGPWFSVWASSPRWWRFRPSDRWVGAYREGAKWLGLAITGTSKNDRERDFAQANGDFIAAANPTAVAKLCNDSDELRETLDQMAVLLRERDEARATLERLALKLSRANALGERWHDGEWCSTPGDELLDALHDDGDCTSCGMHDGGHREGCAALAALDGEG